MEYQSDHRKIILKNNTFVASVWAYPDLKRRIATWPK